MVSKAFINNLKLLLFPFLGLAENFQRATSKAHGCAVDLGAAGIGLVVGRVGYGSLIL